MSDVDEEINWARSSAVVEYRLSQVICQIEMDSAATQRMENDWAHGCPSCKRYFHTRSLGVLKKVRKYVKLAFVAVNEG
jgi:hypothetical protein